MLAKRVLLIDDHPLYRAGVRRALEGSGGYGVVGEASCAYEAIRATESNHPDLMLVDVQLPGISGLAVARILRRKAPRARLVLLSNRIDDGRVLDAFRVGAAALLPRDLSPETLLVALGRIGAGENLLRVVIGRRPDLAQRLRDELAARAEGSVRDSLPLSTRELAVLDCAAQGFSNKEIAEALFLSEQTVKNHLTSVLRKLGVDDRIGAIRHAILRGWMEIGPAARPATPAAVAVAAGRGALAAPRLRDRLPNYSLGD
ncbi:MAG TPA: response regulator transcription factor [Thermomicrobiales bacterium]|nr:response regulator transcription factor [Thermomicrobiales bacterium]